MKPEKAVSLLTWWAQVKLDGIQVNGYARESAFCSPGGHGLPGSKPLLHGRLCDDWTMLDRLLRSGGLSALQYLVVFAAFVPLRDKAGRYVTNQYRAELAQCSMRTLERSKAKAITLVKYSDDKLRAKPVDKSGGIRVKNCHTSSSLQIETSM